PPPEAVEGLPLASYHDLRDGAPDDSPLPGLSRLQERYRRYWGVEPRRGRAVAEAARACGAGGGGVVGVEGRPCLAAVEGAKRVWYAADEWAWHHWTQFRFLRRSTWGELKQAAVKGLYERAYAPLIDRAWVVSEADRRALRRVAGVRGVDVLPNGVDRDHSRPRPPPPAPQTGALRGRPRL